MRPPIYAPLIDTTICAQQDISYNIWYKGAKLASSEGPPDGGAKQPVSI
tara:strand:+ start:2220 stop:2366 length:147 start_codon:yes stop_codon:yes gene_type:complete